jgi:prepilin-type N-terminal cleavage/methylation domain-containing protein
MIKRTRKESGYSMLELSVALGIAAIIAAAGIIATTAFINDAGQKTTDYAANADESIRNAEDQYLKTLAGFWAEAISELEDVSFSSETASLGNTLFYNGNSWTNGNLNFEYLAEIELTNLKAGDVLSWDGSKWVNAEAAPPNISNLTDVQLSNSVAKGSSLVWNGSKWVDGTDGIPGMTKLWTSSSAPEGWLVADGSEVSRTTYAALFATIGTTYGAGNGTTTFNLPDFRGKVAAGFDTAQTEFNALGKTGGAKTVTLTEAQMPSHTHVQNAHGHTGTAASGGGHTHTGNADSGGAHTHAVTVSNAGNHQHQLYTTAGAYRGNSGSETNFQRRGLSWPNMDAAGSHAHTINLDSGGEHSHTLQGVSTAGDHTHTATAAAETATNQNTGGGQAHDNVQPYITLTYIIKH